MAVPSTGGGPSTAGATMSTFRVSPANGTPAAAAVPAPRSRMGAATLPAGIAAQTNGIGIPLSARKATPLDMSTVERKGQVHPSREVPKSNRPFGLLEAPTYRPTAEEFKDPMEYMKKIAPEGRKYGIVKIIPPDSWNPAFAVDTERFHFRTRRQELNSIEGGTRANLNYLDQLSKFHKQHGNNLNRFPSVDKRPLDLFKLKKAVETRGGFDKVCKQKKWAEIGRDLGYSGKIMSSLSTSLKNSYQKWLHPYEEYLRIFKPGVQQLLEFENGGPFTPSPAPSPMKKSHQHTPSSLGGDSPAIRASTALNATLQHDLQPPPLEPQPQRPPMSSGFTAVNAGGFTAVNAQPLPHQHAQPPPPPPAQVSTPSSSFAAINTPNGLHIESRNSTPLRMNGDSPMLSAKNTPDLRPSVLGTTPLSNGQAFNHLKRQLSQDTESGANGDSDAGSGRRSKRLKKDAAPTVAGSHMTQPRLPTPRTFPPRDRANEKPGDRCETCGRADDAATFLLCDSCDAAYHRACLDPTLKSSSDYEWHCPRCLVGTGEFGFEEGSVYSLRQFQDKANSFKEHHFSTKMPFDPVLNTKKPVTEEDVEREFWRLVESITETVEVEYGADVHTTTHGSGFPTIERNPRDPYSTDPWNLNILPYHSESLFRHIRSDISGMTVPWLYVGMVFSTFCWHSEDHYTYSANYQHFGATKTWYGIPGEDAEKFEEAMREAVPELFETQPDLLFQLVTLLTPDQLRKAGVRVYALDQRAGQFVVTFPQAYHAGFNHGFNFNEAVNFAPQDWEPFGEVGVQRLQEFRRPPCFSHDELLLSAAARKDTSIKTAKWLAPALQRMQDREVKARDNFVARHKEFQEHSCKIDNTGDSELKCAIDFVVDDEDIQEEDYNICSWCKCYSYLSRFVCKRSSRVVCLLHAGTFECCEVSEGDRYLGTHGDHQLIFRTTNDALQIVVQRIVDKAGTPEAWAAKLDLALDDGPKPQLKILRSLLSEGERIDWVLPGLPDLKKYVEACTEIAEEAVNYTTRKQQNRRKNERAWRRGNAAKAAEIDERERELRKVTNITKLLKEADDLCFDSPEITALRERSENIEEFQQKAQAALRRDAQTTVEKLDELLEEGKSFNVDLPELDTLDRLVQQMKWFASAREWRTKTGQYLQDVTDFIKQALDLGIPPTDPNIHHFTEQKIQGELWEAKAKELMAVEQVHYQQLDALSKQASNLPVTQETLALVDAILKKQRDAQEQILSLYERSKSANIKDRPKYKDVREAMEALGDLNSKPSGTIDLEKEQKRHEDWMRRGKKLFGKANAPLHILHAHMKTVEEKNRACFDLGDQPRMPVEPRSRETTPGEAENVDGSGSSRDVFCICRKPEAGMMIECELCHEWYHGRCLKIARGKIKDDDKYTCPICDYRVKIPRDATRPKIEDLQNWQDDISNLPFQPEEEGTLEKIIEHGLNFRDWVAKYINPLMSSPDELTTQRFYLRKLEGADILLSNEINFFRQELHKWAPVAPQPPPILEVSLSTRKPRPTKQQKLMAQLGISNPEDLPQNLRTKQHNFKNRKSTDPLPKGPQQIQPAPEPSHTPPGLPRSLSIDGDYHERGSAFNHSNRDISPVTFNMSSHSTNMTSNPPLDPAMFTGPGISHTDFHAGGSPMANPFASSGSQAGGGMDNMFADLTNPEEMGNSHADEALALTTSPDRVDDGTSDFLNV
ncbi:histone demethylase JARID1D [Lophium mytilinum]|uniref:Histone demethylase JARID1D n=1 Tax=Lophium mytilinum TaxID=390894 RepID=A0A6A6QYG5_9PEZI|nr:histone demethylase JARID1D [Lophium mytilinum]